jgi:hypothetical protein
MAGRAAKNQGIASGASMKEPEEWVEADVNDLILNQIQESLVLDYKRCDALQRDGERTKIELSKDVSAFANSAGGILVYGVEEDKHNPTQIDKGYDPDEITKEWIEQVINSKIQRRIDGIRINQIKLSGTRIGKVIYAVYIPPSPHAPHMAADHRFYKRFNFQSIAMEEYEVRDVSRRLESPDLYVTLLTSKIATKGSWLSLFRARFLTFSVELSVGNHSWIPVEECYIRYFWDARLGPTVGYSYNGPRDYYWNRRPVRTTEIRSFGDVILVDFDSYQWQATRRGPIYNSVTNRFATINSALATREGPYYLFWEARAPYMGLKKGAFELQLGVDEVHVAAFPCEFTAKDRNA